MGGRQGVMPCRGLLPLSIFFLSFLSIHIHLLLETPLSKTCFFALKIIKNHKKLEKIIFFGKIFTVKKLFGGEAVSKVVGALWLREYERDGKKKKMLAGELDLGLLGTVKVAIFKNEKKEKENQPDYTVVLSEPNPSNAEPESNDSPIEEDGL